jgi:hypothetical protein
MEGRGEKRREGERRGEGERRYSPITKKSRRVGG